MRFVPEPLQQLLWRYGPATLAVPGLLFTPIANGWLWIGLLMVAGFAQALRIDRPVAAWVMACAAAVLLTAMRPEMYLVTEFVALFPFAQIAAAGELRRTLAFLVASTALALALTVVSAGLPPTSIALFVSVFALPLPVYGAAAAWAHGLATRRKYVEVLIERADRLEREQDQQAELAVLAERGRIARDLHDVITHGVAVMVVQADAADAIWDADPGRGRRAVRDVAETGRSVMGELRAMLDAMRGLDDATAGAERHATAGLEGAGELVRRLDGAGVATTLTVDGDLATVPSPVSLAAERILRESLTNVLRHARATRADVHVRVAPDAVRLRVTDDGVGLVGAVDGGHGIAGMRERAALAGGHVRVATRTDGGTVVEAELPVEAT